MPSPQEQGVSLVVAEQAMSWVCRLPTRRQFVLASEPWRFQDPTGLPFAMESTKAVLKKELHHEN